MHFSSTTARAAIAAATLLSAAVHLHAVVVRHDQTDAATLEAGARFTAAGRVLPDGGCTLIAPSWAVTAAHVAAGLAPGSEIEFESRRYAVSRVFIHPEGASRPGTPPDVDLALIELREPVAGIEPAALYTGRDEVGKTVFLAGYGDYGLETTGFQHTDNRRRAVTNVVDDAGPLRIFMTFDAPPAGTTLEGVGGPGDSGGPAFIDEGGRLFLAGVSSASMNGKPGKYGVVDVYTRISSYVPWIEATMRGAQ